MNNSGTLVIAPIRPQDSADTYPVAYSNEIAGGWHQVQSLSARDAIPDERRVEGMVCYVIDQSAYYVLKGGIDNSNWQTTSSSAITGRLGAPTDGEYGIDGNTVSGILSGDLIEDAFDKVETILEKLAPAKPVNLASVQLVVVNGYSALETGTNILRTTVIDSTLPTVQTPQVTSSGFFDGTDGTLAAFLDSTLVGSKVLSTSNDSGTYGNMVITFDTDYYLGVVGKQNFWYALGAKIIPSVALSTGVHHFQLTHSVTGSALLDVYVDDLLTPGITTPTATPSGTSSRISGVPTMTAGQSITIGATISNAIRSFYNATKIAQITGNAVATVLISPPASPSFGSTYSVNNATVVQSGIYTEHATFVVTGYNSKGNSSSGNLTSNIRVDTISVESGRRTSSTGQFPVSYGSTYNSSTSLLTNEELQLLGGVYKFPPAVNYSTNLPTAGPNYSSIAGGSYNSMRWATFFVGAITNASSINLTFNGSSNFSGTLLSNFALYVRVDGIIPTSGWLDANAAYSGVGSPTANGDPALDYSNSTSTFKRVTFGTTVRTGNVFVRVGIKAGSNLSFASVTLS